MSIFDFLFARAATPEQAQKNIFLDAIDGGGRFGSGDDFRGGPLGISALLNALGVDPYGSTDAQPQAKPQGQSFAPRPPSGPARSLRPQLRPTQQKPDELLTERFGTQFALGTPSEVTTTALPPAPSYDAERMMRINEIPVAAPTVRPFDGAGFGYTAPPLNLLNAQVDQEVTAAQPVNYFNTALRNPDFLPWLNKNYPGYLESIRANSVTAAEKELVARQFMAVPANPRPAQTINGMPIITQKPSPPPESTASSISASPLAMSTAPAALSSSSVGTSGSLPVLSNDGPTNIPTLYETAGSQQYSMPTVPNDAPTSDNPNGHPESQIKRFMNEYGLNRRGAIGALDISLRAYKAQKEMREATQ